MRQSYRYNTLNTAVTKLCVAIKDILCNPIVINACLHYSWGRLVKRNWGDDMNIYLLKRIFRKPLSPLYFSSIAMRKKKEDYMVIGSTIGMQNTERTIVWGAGVIDNSKPLNVIPQKILAVRGPLTRQYLLDQGIECPAIYGDPAMLVKYIYSPLKIKKFKLGIIPHYDDYDSPLLNHFRGNKDILIIHTEGYKNWHSFIDEICSCECVASSSLHGLIIAETYDIPNLWIEFSNKIIGGHFKFHDFFQSIGQDRDSPYNMTSTTSSDDVLGEMQNYIKGNISLQPLIDAAPFKLYL